MRQKTIFRELGALTVALLLMLGLAGAAFAQSGAVIDDPGVLITGVVAASPAATAGLVRGDVILAVDGAPINDAQELAAAVQAVEPGATVELTIRHGDDERTLPVALTESDGRSFLGVRPYLEEETLLPQGEPAEVISANPITATIELSGTAPISEAEAVEAAELGVAVAAVLPDSPAQAAGLAPGDLIVAVDGVTVTSAADLVGLIAGYAPGDQVVLSVVYAGTSETQPVAVTLAGRPDDDDEAYLGVSVGSVIEAGAYEDRDDDHEWNDEDGWHNPDDGWECPFDGGDGSRGYPPQSRGWRRLMPHSGHPHGHMGCQCPMGMPHDAQPDNKLGWNAAKAMPYGVRLTPWRIPYHGQGYGQHR